MSQKVFEFGFGEQKVALPLEEKKILHEIEGQSVQAVTNVRDAVIDALRNPIGSPALKSVVKPGEKVVVVTSDITRGWIRYDLFLSILLDELNAAGVPDKDIEIVVGLGAHRPHTPEENVLAYGKEVCQRVKIYQHDSLDKDNLAYVGTTSNGIKTYINKKVVTADKVVLTGGIVYHLMAGFGGGRKSVLPGICGYDTIQANHSLCLNKEVGKGLNPNCLPGKLKGNDMHEDMMEMAAFLKPAFILNAVLTPEGKFAKFVAGDWRKAWEEGCKTVEQIYGIPITSKADLVIASAGGFPKDINLYQGSKTIDNAYMAVRPGGVIICFLECRDIFEPAEFSDWFKYSDMLEFEKALRKKFTVPGFIAFKCASIAKAVSLIVVTKPENETFVKNAGMIPATSAEGALAIAQEKLGSQDYKVTVMAHAANTVPVLK